jgi:uracil-DNA glycosylase family 4
LLLRNAYITATIRCAPPGNKPLLGEVLHCRPFLETELELLSPRAVLALGRIAFDAYLRLLHARGLVGRPTAYKFRHGAEYQLPGALPRLFASYHPSQQNTQTGRLTPRMFLRVLRRIRAFLNEP